MHEPPFARFHIGPIIDENPNMPKKYFRYIQFTKWDIVLRFANNALIMQIFLHLQASKKGL